MENAMDLALTSALSAVNSAERGLEVTAQNLSNSATDGYLAGQSHFETLMNVYNNEGNRSTSLPWGTQAAVSGLNTLPGPLRYTGVPTDLALGAQDAYFAVETDSGVAYTKAGSFHWDAQGKLVTVQGDAVLGDKGPIVAGKGGGEVLTDGTVNGADGTAVATLRRVALKGDLAPAGKALYRPLDDGAQVQESKAEVLVGHLQGSATDTFHEMAEMVALMRMAESGQKAANMADQSNSECIRAMRLS